MANYVFVAVFILLYYFSGICKAEISRCGFSTNDTRKFHRRLRRVVGGDEAKQNSWPWVINLVKKNNKQHCTGSIIGDKWILTAAHCFSVQYHLGSIADYTYHAADHNLNVTDVGEFLLDPSDLYIHPKYISGNLTHPGNYDIALLKLKTAITFNKVVRPVCLPKQTTKLSQNDTCYVTGWGNTKNGIGYHRSAVLKEGKLKYVPLKECNGNKSYKNNVPSTFFCMGSENGGVDGCYGDSGGPLQCKKGNVWMQFGTMIWGIGCAEPNHYGVYLDLRRLLPFIKKIQEGPSTSLTAYYENSLGDIDNYPNKMGSLILYNVLTNYSYFSDIDLVRNLQLPPKYIEALKKTTLKNLEFVSNRTFEMTTRLVNISRVVTKQRDRFIMYYKAIVLAHQLNITFDEVVRLSKLSLQNLFNSELGVLDDVEKIFYVNSYARKLSNYQKIWMIGHCGILINIDTLKEKLMNMSLEELRSLDTQYIKLQLLKNNKKLFTRVLTIMDISLFLEKPLGELFNMTLSEILQNVLNISVSDFASMYQIKVSSLDLVKSWKISSAYYPANKNVLVLAMDMLHSPCTSSPCKHGAVCSANGYWTYTCSCKHNFIGKHCEYKIKECSKDWVRFSNHCYRKSVKQLPVHRASKECINLGGKLVEIESKDENNFMKREFSDDHYWIHGIPHSGKTDFSILYGSWKTTVNSAKRYCVSWEKSGALTFIDCNERLKAICRTDGYIFYIAG